MIAFVGVIAVLYMMMSGFKYVTAGGDAKKAGEAKEGITHALIGIAITLVAYLLVDQVYSMLGAEDPEWYIIDK